jgi:hypothetical protein
MGFLNPYSHLFLKAPMKSLVPFIAGEGGGGVQHRFIYHFTR